MTAPDPLQTAIAHEQAGRFADAEAIYRNALLQQPDHFAATFLLGRLYLMTNRLPPAVDMLQRAIRVQPGYADAHYNLGLALRLAGRWGEAIPAFRQAISLRPDFADVHAHLAIALKLHGQLDDAITSLRRAIELRPDLANAHYNLGLALGEKGEHEAAIRAYQNALRCNPAFAEAHNNLGSALLHTDRLQEAIDSLHAAIRGAPDSAEPHFNLGLALQKADEPDAAIASFHRALALRPDYPEAHNNLGNVLKQLGRLDEAMDAFRHALALNPQFAAGAHGNLAFAQLYHPAYDAAMIHAELQRWNKAHGVPSNSAIHPHTNDRDPNRRLRIGYVSPDFRRHVVGQNILPLLANHDPAQVEIFCYSNAPRADDVTERFRGYAHAWRDIVALSDERAAEIIRDDRIDILVDLALHTRGQRLGIFARKPAPVQATFAGYPGSTGLETIDYRLTDPYLDPPGLDDAFYSEASFRLAHTFWCYQPAQPEIAVSPLPAESRGHITFGCLNNFCKINAPTLRIWARVLQAVPTSHLLMMAPAASAQARVLEVFSNAGIAAARIAFVGKQMRAEYLRTYHRIDLGLDTLPYNGHTTSLDSLWMGVPVLTLAGKTVVGRAGVSQLTNVGLPEFIARTADEFVARAAAIALDIPALAAIRHSLRNKMERSPLMDARGFAHDIETGYRTIWRRWAGGM